MNRAGSTLRKPDPNRDYSGFPIFHQPGRARWCRAHGPHNPWYFSNLPGRFNLTPPHGTLNVASSREVAARELLGEVLVGDPVIPASAVVERWVTALEIPALSAADFTADGAPAFGVIPADVTAPMDDGYVTTRAWAARIHETGFGGILARSRFGTGLAPHCLYVFGPAGEHEWGATVERRSLRSIIETIPGYRIDRTPMSDTLIIDP